MNNLPIFPSFVVSGEMLKLNFLSCDQLSNYSDNLEYLLLPL